MFFYQPFKTGDKKFSFQFLGGVLRAWLWPGFSQFSAQCISQEHGEVYLWKDAGKHSQVHQPSMYNPFVGSNKRASATSKRLTSATIGRRWFTHWGSDVWYCHVGALVIHRSSNVRTCILTNIYDYTLPPFVPVKSVFTLHRWYLDTT